MYEAELRVQEAERALRVRDAAEDFVAHFKTQQIAWHPLFRELMAVLGGGDGQQERKEGAT